jgi:hypothetical protein
MFLAHLLLSLSVTSGMPRERACSLVRSEVGMHTMSLSSPDFNYTVKEGKRKEREGEEGRKEKGREGVCETVSQSVCKIVNQSVSQSVSV